MRRNNKLSESYDKKRNTKSAAHTDSRKKCNIPAVLTCIVMLLYIGADYLLTGNYINSDNPYATVVIAQMCVFLLPCAFFLAIGTISGGGGLARYKFNIFSPKMIGFVLSCVPTLVFGSMIIKYLTLVYFGNSDSSAISISGNSDFLYILLSSVIVPAIAEEILLRGIVYTEYEKKLGALGAVIGSSVLFAFLHFDAANFFSYLYAGIILAVSVHITRSIIAPIFLHLLNNFLCIYSDAFLQRISKESISTAFVLITLGALLLISLFIFFETLEWICVYKADKLVSHDPLKQDEVVRLVPEKEKAVNIISRVIFAPAFLVALVIFLVRVIALT